MRFLVVRCQSHLQDVVFLGILVRSAACGLFCLTTETKNIKFKHADFSRKSLSKILVI